MRTSINGIKKIRLNDDSFASEYEEVKEACVGYYIALLGTSSHHILI